jgi:hypothetical protein
MLPLRYRRVWHLAGALVLGLVLIGTLLPAMGFWPDISFRSIIALDKWQHALTFLFLSVWFSGQYARQAYWRIGLGLVVFGGVIEIVQRSLSYRSADMADMLANIVGIGIGLAVALAGLGGWSLRVEGWLCARRAEQD